MKKAKKFIVAALAVVSTLSFVVLGASCKGKDVLKTKFDQLICNHEYEEEVQKEATCGEKGILLKTCVKCGKETKSDIKKTDHNPNHIEVIAAVEATCVKNGSSEGKKCMDCGEWVEAPKVEAAKAHTLVEVKGYAATCTEEGLSDGKLCTTCEQMIIPQEVIAPLGHNMVTDRAVAATCTKTGLTEGNHCSRCETVGIAQEVVEKKAHTLNEDGKCTVCGGIDYEAFIAGGVTTKEVTGRLEAGKVYRVELAKYEGNEPLGICYDSEDEHIITTSIYINLNPGVVTGSAGSYALSGNYECELHYSYQPVVGSYENNVYYTPEINLLDYFEFYLTEDGAYLDIVVLKDEIKAEGATLYFARCTLGAMTELVRSEASAATVSAEWVLPPRKDEIVDDYGYDIYY